MRKALLLLLAVCSTSCSSPQWDWWQGNSFWHHYQSVLVELKAFLKIYEPSKIQPIFPSDGIKEMLIKQTKQLNSNAINKVATTLKCANELNIDHNTILAIIDYSLPSSQKRLWVFDLKKKKLLFHTYVSHGLKSGTLFTRYFSNRYNSKASSLGVYETVGTYYGREGLSLRLEGLEGGFNDNAANRSIVMHEGWYVDEDFIKKYGRAGRSWGCPALPPDRSDEIIKTIKEKTLFIVYYPSENWFLKSRFLNCKSVFHMKMDYDKTKEITQLEKPNGHSEKILFADRNKDQAREETDPVLVMQADQYQQVFDKRPPLRRMLRRQINDTEYIALSNQELDQLIADKDRLTKNHETPLNQIYFVVPEIKMDRGYYKTIMKFVNFGKIKSIEASGSATNEQRSNSYLIYFDDRPALKLIASDQFIRWLGL